MSISELSVVKPRVEGPSKPTIAISRPSRDCELQVLYGILVQHFADLAGQAPLPMAHLDALTGQLLDLTGEVPFYAATVARARLSRVQERLSTVLSDSVSLLVHHGLHTC